MKKRVSKILIILCLVLTITGCRGAAEQEVLKNITYSNLKEKEIQDTLKAVMEDADISKKRQEIFFDYVDKLNETVSEEELTEGYEEAEISFVKYDPYAMQEEWMAAYPDFLGYNCRITAFSLFADFLEIPADSEIRDEMILMDMYALEADNTAIEDEEELKKYKILFSTIPAENTKDIAGHVDENENYLFIGHTGILIPHEDELFFIEKLAFQEPYQLTIFKNRTELNDYLMTKYDTSVGQPTAKPFIMENDQLLEGYRK